MVLIMRFGDYGPVGVNSGIAINPGMAVPGLETSVVVAVVANVAGRLRRVGRREPMRKHAGDAGDEEAEERKEDDRVVHAQPFMTLMSSTAIEPRLR
jgi:hypothetical protein